MIRQTFCSIAFPLKLQYIIETGVIFSRRLVLNLNQV
jgi:hypothetical protein